MLTFTPNDVEAAARRALEQNTGFDAPSSIHFINGVDAVLHELWQAGCTAMAPIAAARAECVGKGDDWRVALLRAEKARASANLTTQLRDSAAQAEHDEALQTSEHNPAPTPPLDDKDRAMIGEGRRVRDFGRAS